MSEVVRIPFRYEFSEKDNPPRLFDIIDYGGARIVEFKYSGGKEKIPLERFVEQFNKVCEEDLLKD